MQLNRMFEIVYILLNKKSITAKELSEYFEVSTRTIYRDIDSLSSAGIPIYTSKGKGGGIYLLDNFVLNKSLLSEQEQNEILSALQTMYATNMDVDKSILNKLKTIFNKDILDWVEVDFSNWGNTCKDYFDIIKLSILNNNIISFDYYNALGEKTNRKVEPVQLWFKEKTWYLKAYCLEKNGLRLFKLTRIKNLVSLKENFIPKDYKEKDSQEKEFINNNLVTLTLKIDGSQAYRVYDDFNEDEIVKNEDNSFLITTSFPEDEWVYGYILSYGPFIEVINSPYIKQIIKQKLQDTIKLYS